MQNTTERLKRRVHLSLNMLNCFTIEKRRSAINHVSSHEYKQQFENLTVCAIHW